MFITQKHLSRRTVLRGIGATVALPFLDAMVPAATQLRKTVAVRKPRLLRSRWCMAPRAPRWRDWRSTTGLRLKRAATSTSRSACRHLSRFGITSRLSVIRISPTLNQPQRQRLEATIIGHLQCS